MIENGNSEQASKCGHYQQARLRIRQGPPYARCEKWFKQTSARTKLILNCKLEVHIITFHLKIDRT